jgi:hypothetical protein
MPNLSESQRRAMAAAAAGDSTIGIPKDVGQDFMAADKGGKLPEKVSDKRTKRQKALYDRKG